jgi:hypothetical protein
MLFSVLTNSTLTRKREEVRHSSVNRRCFKMSDRKYKKDKSKQKKGSSSPSSSNTATSNATTIPAVGPVPMTALQRTIEHEIVTKWTTRPYARFPIHKDIPRFVRSIEVSHANGESLYKPDSTESQSLSVQRLFKSLATVFEPSNVRSYI